MTRQLSGLISTVTAGPVVRFLSLSSIPPSERHRRCCSQRFFPELAEVPLVEQLSFRISRHRPDFERITVAAIEKPVRGSDGLLPSLEYVHYRGSTGPIRYVPMH